jgi:hypothetical protein
MHGFKWYPAAWLGGINALIAALVAFGFMTQTVAGYTATIATGAVGLVSWWFVRPLALPVFTSLVSTILVAVASFGVHINGKVLDDHMVAAAAVLITMIAYGVLHLGGVPTAGSPSVADPKLAALLAGGPASAKAASSR